MSYTKEEETNMIKQLSTGQVVNLSNLENMHDLFTNEQFEIIEAYLEYQEELNELNERYHWLDNLHQERFHFITKDAQLFQRIVTLMDTYK